MGLAQGGERRGREGMGQEWEGKGAWGYMDVCVCARLLLKFPMSEHLR